MADAGEARAEYQYRVIRDLPCKRVQVDKIWSFVYAKEKNAPLDKKVAGEAGDIWTWTAIDTDTKLVPSWYVGKRDAEAARVFVGDLAARLANRVQLTRDGHRPYLEAVEGAFGADMDYGMLVKVYGQAPEGQRRYSPPVCIGAHRGRVTGSPDPKHLSTSFVERQNLTMRMSMPRFTRLTNAFGKKLANHVHAIAIYFMHCDFVRIYQSLRVTPAMAAGVTGRLWEVTDAIQIVEEWEIAQATY